MIKAKKITEENNQVERFELFKEVVAKDTKDQEVTILQSIGHYTLADLKRQKEQLNDNIAGIDEKIEAINKLSVIKK